MKKLKLQMQVTVDGFNPSGLGPDLDWDEIRGYSCELLDTADTIVIGRKTALEFIPHWDKSATNPDESWYEVARRISAARKVVFSKTLASSEWRNTDVEQGNLADAIRRLKSTGKKDIIVYGGISFVSALIKERLIDEFHLFVNPVTLGKGLSVFSELGDPQQFRLIKSIAFNNGLVLLHYEPK